MVEVALTRREAASAPRGVSGSLEEMTLPDLVQLLSNGRKSGKLVFVFPGKRGELHFGSGMVYDAFLGDLRGAEAFYALLGLPGGTFSLDPSFVPPVNLIEQSTEGLLLEGMRRMDESLR